MARYKDHCAPSIKAGTIGEHVKSPPFVLPMSGRPRAEDTDRETGRPARYANPSGFIGLHGNQTGKNWWEKAGGLRETKVRTQPTPGGLKGEPF